MKQGFQLRQSPQPWEMRQFSGLGLSITAWCSCLLRPCAVVCECSHQCALGPSPWHNCMLRAFLLRSVILWLASTRVHHWTSQISPMGKLTLPFERITCTISYLVVKSAHWLPDSSVHPARLWRQTQKQVPPSLSPGCSWLSEMAAWLRMLSFCLDLKFVFFLQCAKSYLK